MEHQDHRVSVQFGRAGDSGSGTHLAVPHRRKQVAAPRPLVVILKSLAICLGPA